MPKTSDQIANLDAELDALSSPTTADTYNVTKDYDTDVVAAAATTRALSGGGGGGGGDIDSLVVSPADPETPALEIRPNPGATDNYTDAFVIYSDTGEYLAELTAGGTFDFWYSRVPGGNFGIHGEGNGGINVADVSGETWTRINAERLAFFASTTPVTRPEVPASPTAQDVVDALVALGLVSQAS